jgi:hypothetical protein
MIKRFNLVLACLILNVANADIYMHNPRGSNDRNCERNVNRNNGNRLFDSQNNNNGGYACERPGKSVVLTCCDYLLTFYRVNTSLNMCSWRSFNAGKRLKWCSFHKNNQNITRTRQNSTPSLIPVEQITFRTSKCIIMRAVSYQSNLPTSMDVEAIPKSHAKSSCSMRARILLILSINV